MAEVPKPTYVTYRDADPKLRTAMNRLLDGIENSPGRVEIIDAFGREELARFRQAIEALEEFLADPTYPEAPAEEKERLRKQYLSGAQGVSLVLGAGGEALRRYDAQYIPDAVRTYEQEQSTASSEYLRFVSECRAALACRLVEIELPEKTDAFVKGAVTRIEAAEAFKRSISNGLPLEVAITVRKSPLKLVMPKAPGAA